MELCVGQSIFEQLEKLDKVVDLWKTQSLETLIEASQGPSVLAEIQQNIEKQVEKEENAMNEALEMVC